MAHRQVPIAEQDWHLLGCRVEEGGPIYVNTVGTFGVASARIIGRESRQPSDASPSTSLGLVRKHGTCSLPMKTTWKPRVKPTVQP